MYCVLPCSLDLHISIPMCWIIRFSTFSAFLISTSTNRIIFPFQIHNSAPGIALRVKPSRRDSICPLSFTSMTSTNHSDKPTFESLFTSVLTAFASNTAQPPSSSSLLEALPTEDTSIGTLRHLCRYIAKG